MSVTIDNPRMARQAIQTRFVGPTNTRGARVIARADAGRVVHYWEYALGEAGNHAEAARKFCEQYGWYGRLACGALPGSGYAFCFVEESK